MWFWTECSHFIGSEGFQVTLEFNRSQRTSGTSYEVQNTVFPCAAIFSEEFHENHINFESILKHLLSKGDVDCRSIDFNMDLL